MYPKKNPNVSQKKHAETKKPRQSTPFSHQTQQQQRHYRRQEGQRTPHLSMSPAFQRVTSPSDMPPATRQAFAEPKSVVMAVAMHWKGEGAPTEATTGREALGDDKSKEANSSRGSTPMVPSANSSRLPPSPPVLLVLLLLLLVPSCTERPHAPEGHQATAALRVRFFKLIAAADEVVGRDTS